MGFVLTKILLFLLLPPSCILLLMLAGLFLARRNRRAGMSLVSLGLVLLYLLSISPVSDLLIRPLETFAPPFTGAAGHVDAVVVLGGGVRDLGWVPAPPEPSAASLQRLVKGIELARKLGVPLVVSGGSGEIAPGSVREADAMAESAVRLGFPRERIITENASRNTLENARETARLVPGRTVVLATSAFHMKRASGMFRKQGFTVIPAPTGYYAGGRRSSPAGLLPHAADLGVSTIALSERLSLLWYGMRNEI